MIEDVLAQRAALRAARRPAPVVVSSKYRCREHPGEPVTWKGTGCQRCQRHDTGSTSTSESEIHR